MEPKQEIVNKTEQGVDVVSTIEPSKQVTTNEKNKGMLYGMITCVVIAVLGVGFGVWAIMTRNLQIAELNSQIDSLKEQLSGLQDDEDDEDDGGYGETSETGHWYGKPASADMIESVYITYNDRSNIEIYDRGVQYFTYDERGNIIDDSFTAIETDTTDIIKYIFDNDLQYLNKNQPNENVEWSIQVNAPGMSCAAFGDSGYPEWFKSLLNKLNIPTED